MTLLKDRLEKAGANTAESRLAVLAIESLREAKGSITSAIEIFWKKLASEAWVAKETWLRPYLEARQHDMRGATPANSEKSKRFERPRLAITRRTTSPEHKVAVEKLIRQAVEIIQFRHKTSDGRDWARVGAHELAGMDRDGALARAIQERLGQLSNSQKFMELGELMTSKQFNEARSAAGQ